LIIFGLAFNHFTMNILISTSMSYTKKCVVMFVLVIRQLHVNALVLCYTGHDTYNWLIINTINAKKEEKKLYGKMTVFANFRQSETLA
jgi:hypothetical protein